MDSRKVTDPLNRGMVGGLLGTPADMLNMLRNGGRSVGNLANRLAGVNAPPAPMVENPVYGQEWWGNKMQQAGYVSPNRNKLAEFGAGLLDPGSVMTDVPMLAKGLFGLGDPATLSAAGGLLGMFAGKGAKTADVLKMDEAMRLLNKGEDAASVWKKTGWGKGPDGKMRFEIPDDIAAFSNAGLEGASGFKNKMKISEGIDHKSLSMAYPDFFNKGDLYFTGNNTGAHGVYNNGQIALDRSGRKDIMLHELQHGVQDIEGFSRGGSLSSANSDSLNHLGKIKEELFPFHSSFEEYSKDYFGTMPEKEIQDRFNKEYARHIVKINRARGVEYHNPAVLEYYKRLAGEAESRLTESRMNMNSQQRLNQYPWDEKYFKEATGVSLGSLIHNK